MIWLPVKDEFCYSSLGTGTIEVRIISKFWATLTR